MAFVDSVSSFLWDYILLFSLVGIGIYMTVLLKFPQIGRASCRERV